MKRYINSAKDLSSEQRIEVAKDSTDPKELSRLAYDNSAKVRQEVAKNRNTPAKAFELLASDDDNDVRRAVAMNRHASSKALELLANDSDTFVRRGVAVNPYTPDKILELLANDGDEYVRWKVAENRNTPTKILELLANDSDADIRKAVAKHRNASSKALELLANDGDWRVRKAVAENPNTPANTLEYLAEDDDDDVRRFARGRINKVSEPSKPKRLSWPKLISQLRSEAEDGVDSLYEETSAGYEITSLCDAVENKLGIWLEPSVQFGQGGIWFYSSADNSRLASDYDYQKYNEQVLDLALQSKNETEFQNKYRSFVQSILDDPAYAPEVDE